MSSTKNCCGFESQGWFQDVLECVSAIPQDEFALEDVYKYEPDLQLLHPQNHNVQAKIRQQLQCLRDAGYIEFLGEGFYRKVGMK